MFFPDWSFLGRVSPSSYAEASALSTTTLPQFMDTIDPFGAVFSSNVGLATTHHMLAQGRPNGGEKGPQGRRTHTEGEDFNNRYKYHKAGERVFPSVPAEVPKHDSSSACLLYTSDAADE